MDIIDNQELLQTLIDEKYVKKIHHPTLPIYLLKYTKSCVYDKKWNNITINCRGHVYQDDGKLIANPFEKFFNYEELEHPLPELPFEITNKLDGSLGICYWYNNDWMMNSSGSFNSEQSKHAKELLDKNINKDKMMKGYTYLFEIIYPDNRIVVDYGNKDELILLSIKKEKEVSYTKLYHHSLLIGCDVTIKIEFKSLSELFEQKTKLTSNEEGYVITFSDGFKFKLKGDEYFKLHKVINGINYKNFLEHFDFEIGWVDRVFLEYIPEEFRLLSDNIVKDIETEYENIFKSVITAFNNLPFFVDRKEMFLYLKEKHPEYFHIIMAYSDDKFDKVYKYIRQKLYNHFKTC